MWPECVVFSPPPFNDHSGFAKSEEDLHVEYLIYQLSIEGLVVSILPGTARLNDQGGATDPLKPFSDRCSGEFESIVCADVPRGGPCSAKGSVRQRSTLSELIFLATTKHIHIGSIRSLLGIHRGYIAYCTSKGGMNLMIKQLASEWAKHNITVNGIAPTFIRSELVKQYLEAQNFYDPPGCQNSNASRGWGARLGRFGGFSICTGR
jgi:NAD(P)-dependent dehydrogenase (short-subunit alcohol dehydrogenase family)